MRAEKIMNILVAEDDIDDRLLITKAFKESFDKANLICVENGEILLQYLKRQGKFQDIEKYPLPQLILLDLNMPKKDGREALVEIKSDTELKKIPVIVFTTSKLEDDIKATYSSGTNSYITKPGTFDGLLSIGKELETYWAKTVLLPD
ncbi:putative two-component response regulator [Indibacter alkaliphilus LW1]|uniref:Two-component response regulator n=1 Tax=Indibacter alkaliphilus (strain CCUG 57479 / KCTC 22604 / LW1) TaxID=1189612 RepID=S2DUY5_INDAL|nr:response regulator [Indibacter alkaliphilus]EOZ93633.1 putative two-component response regulator [Indibacter alkaliphilus LW1]